MNIIGSPRWDELRRSVGVPADAYMRDGKLFVSSMFSDQFIRKATNVDIAFFKLEDAIIAEEKEQEEERERALYEKLKRKFEK